MQSRFLLLAALFLAACGDASEDSSQPPADGALQEDAAAQEEAAAQEASDSDGGAEADSGSDALSDAPHETSLEPAEIELITSGGEDDPMTIVTVATEEGNAFLHQTALEVDPLDPMVQLLIKRMRMTLGMQLGGVGLAAPQVGISRRLFLAQRTDQSGMPTQAFLNPDITELGPETAADNEGCLSSPGQQISVTRSLWVTVSYHTESGELVTGETIGSATESKKAFAARIVQHEYDHLDGILIVDKQ